MLSKGRRQFQIP